MKQFYIINDWQLSKVEQVAKAVRTEISHNRLKAGAQLPSINEFSKTYAVARETVEKAYAVLKRERLICSIKGKGYYVLEKCDRSFKVLIIKDSDSTVKIEECGDLFRQFARAEIKVDIEICYTDSSKLKGVSQNNDKKYDCYIFIPSGENRYDNLMVKAGLPS